MHLHLHSQDKAACQDVIFEIFTSLVCLLHSRFQDLGGTRTLQSVICKVRSVNPRLANQNVVLPSLA